MKNVLHIMDYAAPYKGNFIHSIENLEIHLLKSGYRLIYMLPSVTQNFDWVIQLESERKPVYFIDRSFFSKQIKWDNIKLLLKVLEDEQVSIIHTNFVAHNYSLFIVKNLLKRNIQIIGQFQNHYLLSENLYRRFKICVVKNTFDRIIGVSDSVEKSILDINIPRVNVSCVFNSLAHERLNKYETLSLKKTPNQKIVLMFGWPFYRKGVDLALEIMKQFNDEGLDTLLAISLPGGKEIIEKEIQNKLGEIPSWIILLNAREDVATYYNAADVFISPSREEGYTFAVLEAAYCNCMVVVSTIGGNPQDIPFIGKFESENQVELKKVLIEMFAKTAEEIKVINKSQKEYVAKTYNIDKWSNEIIDIYSTI